MDRKSATRFRVYWPFLVLIPALLLRIHSAIATPPIVVERSSTYLDQASELVHDFKFSNPESLRRPPTYPLFLALNLWLFGENLWAITWVQHFLGVGAVVMLMLAGHRAWNHPLTTAIIGLLVGADPLLIAYEAHIESETVFIFLMASVLCLLANITSQKHYRLAG